MPLTPDQALAVTSRLFDRLVDRRSDIDSLEAYYRGEQSLRFATDQWRAEHEKRYEGFSDNWCGVVGSAAAEVTEVIGFRVGDDVTPLDDAERSLWRHWQANELPAQSQQGWQTTNVARRSFALVWATPDGEPMVTWEHPSQVIVEHDVERPRFRRYALKAWSDGDMDYATLYTPDEVWKWQAKGFDADIVQRAQDRGLILPSRAVSGGRRWQQREVPGESWPMRNPLRVVPVVEFPNRPQLKHGPISDIDGTRSMQDAINVMWAYLMVAADFASLPQRVILGQSPPKFPILDDNGQKIGEQVVDLEDLRNGRLLFLSGKDTKLGEFSASSSDFFLNVINVLARHISQQTKTPIYLIHGELGNVNGDTLAALNEPRNSKVRESHRHLGAGIRELMRLVALIDTDLGPVVADACRTGEVLWQNPATVSDAQRSDAAMKDKAVGLPIETILEHRYGYTQAEVDRTLARIDANSAREIASAVAPILRPQRQPGEPAPAEPAA